MGVFSVVAPAALDASCSEAGSVSPLHIHPLCKGGDGDVSFCSLAPHRPGCVLSPGSSADARVDASFCHWDLAVVEHGGICRGLVHAGLGT